MSEDINIEQEKLKVGPSIWLCFIIMSLFGYVAFAIPVYDLFYHKIRFGIFGYIFVIIGDITVFFLCSWAFSNSLLIHSERNGRALTKFLSQLSKNKPVNLVKVKYAQQYYLFWFAKYYSHLLTNTPIIITIHEHKLNSILQSYNNVNNDNKKINKMVVRLSQSELETIVKTIIGQIKNTNQETDFLLTLKYAKERHPNETILYTKLHPLLVDYTKRYILKN